MSTYPMTSRARRATAPVTRELLGHVVLSQLNGEDIDALPDNVRDVVDRAMGGVVVYLVSDSTTVSSTSLLIVNRRAGTR